MNPGIKAVFFDLDNTLIDFLKMKREACNAAIDAMLGAGLGVDKKKATDTLWGLYDRYGIEYQKIFQVLLKQLIGKIDYKIMASGIVAYRKVKEGLQYPYPQAQSTLRELRKRGYMLAIVTDAPRLQAWLRLVALGLQDDFNLVITRGETHATKAEGIPFRMALRKAKLKPGEAIMVGDWPERDIAPARKLGMVTVLAKYGMMKEVLTKKGITGKEAKADYEINSIGEMLRIL